MKKGLLLTVCVLLLLLLPACATGGERGETMLSRESFLLDTRIEIKLYDWEEADILTEAMKEISRLEQLLGADVEGSDLYRLAQAAGREWVEISPECEEVLRLAQEFYVLSGGYFDVTVGPLIDLWDIHYNEGHVPTRAELSEAMSYIEFAQLHVEPGRAFLESQGMKLDLGGIAKGYIGDCISQFLMEAGVEHAVIDLGLDIQMIGGHVDGSGFLIGVKSPVEEEDRVVQVLELSGKSVVTAGTDQRYFEENGVRYHHILNPFTGFPADTGVLSVTVIADQSAIGDAWSTICLLLGPEEGIPLVEAQPDIEAFYMMEDGSRAMSSGYSAYVVETLYEE